MWIILLILTFHLLISCIFAAGNFYLEINYILMKRLCSTRFSNGAVNFSLLVLRLALGLMLFTHGWGKLQHFNEMAGGFSDPLHIGSRISLMLTIFSEVICAAFLVLGLFTRLAVIPILVQMAVILLMIFHHDAFSKQELAWHYLVGAVVILFCGPGKVSVDGMISG